MKYKVLEIRDGWDPFWGHVVSVAANPVKRIGLCLGSSPFINNETQFFIFPDWEEILNPIQTIAESNDFWSPSEDFSIETRKLDNGQTIKMYFHTTLFDNVGHRTNNVSYDVTMNRGLSSTIPNLNEKVDVIWQQYLKETNGEYFVDSYVRELPRAELLQYLFDIDYLNDDDLTTCGMRQAAFDDFIYKLQDLEEKLENQE